MAKTLSFKMLLNNISFYRIINILLGVGEIREVYFNRNTNISVLKMYH